MLRHVITQALKSNLDTITVVVGYQKDEVKRSLGEQNQNKRLEFVENTEYELGLSTSLKAGLNAIEPKTDAAMFILGDQPKVTTELLNELIGAYKISNAQLCLPMVPNSTSNRPGNPVIISKKLYPEVQKITGDHGAREIVDDHISSAKLIRLKDDSSQFQINTQEDLKAYLGESK